MKPIGGEVNPIFPSPNAEGTFWLCPSLACLFLKYVIQVMTLLCQPSALHEMGFLCFYEDLHCLVVSGMETHSHLPLMNFVRGSLSPGKTAFYKHHYAFVIAVLLTLRSFLWFQLLCSHGNSKHALGTKKLFLLSNQSLPLSSTCSCVCA